MEERQFLHSLCAIALQVDISIEFAGIVDPNGKLLVGKSKSIPRNFPSSKRCKNTAYAKSFNDHLTPFFKNNAISTNNIKNTTSLQSSSLINNHSLFRLIHLNDN